MSPAVLPTAEACSSSTVAAEGLPARILPRAGTPTVQFGRGRDIRLLTSQDADADRLKEPNVGVSLDDNSRDDATAESAADLVDRVYQFKTPVYWTAGVGWLIFGASSLTAAG